MLKNKNYIFAIFIVPFIAKAQSTVHTNVLWAGYQGSIVFNKKWSVTTDVQIRTKNWAQNWLLYNIRTGLNYKFNEKISVTTGLAIFRTTQYDGNQYFYKNDWRLWQEFLYKQQFSSTTLAHRFRTEERFLQQVNNNKKTNQYQFMLRFRYRMEWQLPIVKNKWMVMIGDELMVNPTYINQSQFFDQNRTYAGIQLKIPSNTALQIQYYKILQWQSNTALLEDQNAIRVNLIQQFNFNKHKSAQ